MERFYDFIVDEFAENSLLTIFEINKYFLNNYIDKLSSQNLNKNSQKLHITIIKNFLSSLANNDIKSMEL